jgi:signal transduction histidine kinase
MKIQTKVLFLLTVVIVCFFCAVFLLRKVEEKRLALYRVNLLTQSHMYFDKILDLNGNSLNLFTMDYSNWDEMVKFVSTVSPKWAAQNLVVGLNTYKSDSVWIFDPGLKLRYSTTHSDHPDLTKYGIDTAMLKDLFAKNYFSHYFAKTPYGFVEIRTAPIQPTADDKRETPPKGYMLAGKLWTKDYINEISAIAEARVAVSEGAAGKENGEMGEYKASFIEPLPGWDGKPVASLYIEKELYGAREFARIASYEMYLSIVFAIAMFLLLYTRLMNWVNKPLSAIMKSLKAGNSLPLEELHSKEVEIKQIAALIRSFFEQNEKILKGTEERERLQLQLMQASKLASMGTMAGGVAHELNNPITGILGFAQLLIQNLQGDERNVEDAKRIEALSLRCRNIITTLLAFARQENVKLSHVDVNEAVERTMELAGNQLRVSGIEVEKQLLSPLPMVNANIVQLQQVFLNLITNASFAMGKNGKLTIITGVDRDNVFVKFSDTGPGISKENILKIFDPFFTTKPVGQGTGLGLSLSHGIISALGGKIEVESVEGAGTTFTIILPSAAAGKL